MLIFMEKNTEELYTGLHEASFNVKFHFDLTLLAGRENAFF